MGTDFPAHCMDWKDNRTQNMKALQISICCFHPFLITTFFINAFLLCHEDTYCLGLWCTGLMGKCEQLRRIWGNPIKQHRVKKDLHSTFSGFLYSVTYKIDAVSQRWFDSVKAVHMSWDFNFIYYVTTKHVPDFEHWLCLTHKRRQRPKSPVNH